MRYETPIGTFSFYHQAEQACSSHDLESDCINFVHEECDRLETISLERFTELRKEYHRLCDFFLEGCESFWRGKDISIETWHRWQELQAICTHPFYVYGPGVVSAGPVGISWIDDTDGFGPRKLSSTVLCF